MRCSDWQLYISCPDWVFSIIMADCRIHEHIPEEHRRRQSYQIGHSVWSWCLMFQFWYNKDMSHVILFMVNNSTGGSIVISGVEVVLGFSGVSTFTASTCFVTLLVLTPTTGAGTSPGGVGLSAGVSLQCSLCVCCFSTVDLHWVRHACVRSRSRCTCRGFIECFTTTILLIHSCLNWVDEDDWWGWGWQERKTRRH